MQEILDKIERARNDFDLLQIVKQINAFDGDKETLRKHLARKSRLLVHVKPVTNRINY